MTNRDEANEAILNAAWTLIEQRGWRTLGLADVAVEAKAPLIEIYRAFPTKLHLLAALVAQTDRQVLDQGASEDGEAVHDRLFDVLMRRFDVLAPHRGAIRAMLSEAPTSPPTLLALTSCLATSMAWMVEAAGLSSAGLSGLLRAQGLGVVYLQTLRVWVEDEDELSRTMAALDKNLRRAEWIARRLPFFATSVPPAEAVETVVAAEGEDPAVAPPLEQQAESPAR